MPPSKPAVVHALRQRLREHIAALSAVVEMARDEATSAESKCESKYDTRATEASYLAAGQGRRLQELQQQLSWAAGLDPGAPREHVSLGALVGVEEEAGTRWLFVAPAGGERLVVEGVTVAVISTSSTLGEALLGLEEGDGAEVEGPVPRELEVVEIS